MPPTFETKVCISLILPSPYTFYFVAAFLLFLLTASTPSPPTLILLPRALPVLGDAWDALDTF